MYRSSMSEPSPTKKQKGKTNRPSLPYNNNSPQPPEFVGPISSRQQTVYGTLKFENRAPLHVSHGAKEKFIWSQIIETNECIPGKRDLCMRVWIFHGKLWRLWVEIERAGTATRTYLVGARDKETIIDWMRGAMARSVAVGNQTIPKNAWENLLYDMQQKYEFA
jgi:hypothetical protein